MKIALVQFMSRSCENLRGTFIHKRIVSTGLCLTLLNGSLAARAEVPVIVDGDHFYDALAEQPEVAVAPQEAPDMRETAVAKGRAVLKDGAAQGYAEGDAIASLLRVPNVGKAIFTHPGALLGTVLAVAICASELSKKFGKLDDLDKNVRIAFGWGYSLYWRAKNLMGYYQTPVSLERIIPQSEDNPDGALPYENLVYDPSDPSSIKIRSSVEAALVGEPLKNAIYYGDAGTGKSASVQSFSHIPNFEVYSVSGDSLSGWAFVELTEWVKHVSSPNRRILIDISEGDELLKKITGNEAFRNYFKRNYDREQANHAIVISCNFNTKVSSAIKIISRDQDLARRFEDRVRFSSPGPKTRLALLKKSVFSTIDRKFPGDRDIEDFFSDTVFGDAELLSNKFTEYTSDLSHSRVENLGEKIVFLYALARSDMDTGVHPSLLEFDFIDEFPSQYQLPLERILAFMGDRNSENEWLEQNEKQLLEQQYEERVKKMKYAKIEAEYNKLIEQAKRQDSLEAKGESEKTTGKDSEPHAQEKRRPHFLESDENIRPTYW